MQLKGVEKKTIASLFFNINITVYNTTSFEATNQNYKKYPKFLSKQTKDRVYKTLDTSTIYSPFFFPP